MIHHSLLDDALFRVDTSSGPASFTLPQVLAALRDDAVWSFEGLQAHQEQAWYTFLVQLAAMATVRASGGSVPADADAWRTALLDLADGEASAWALVVDDLDRPAFMQPPVPEGSLDDAKFKDDIPSPSSLDVLVTSKNHDVKQNRLAHPRLEHWIYALVTLQTMEGFLGRGNYGVVRMNGGFGNRPLVGVSPDLSFGARFGRDLGVLVERRGEMPGLYDPTSGKTLLWTDPWDGSKGDAIPIDACDPYFIEVCRRIRFTQDDGALTCWRANTKGQRVDAPDALNGQTGDPWTPIDTEENKALTLGGSGFTYEKLRQIVLDPNEKYASPMALTFHDEDDGAMYLVARAMVRGQGKTEGLHHRVIPIPRRARVLFSTPTERRALAERAEQRAKKASDVETNVLKPAVASLLSAGRDGDVDWDQVQPWIDAFDDVVDEHFYSHLWASVREDESLRENAAKAQREWQRFLRIEAEKQFADVQRSVPLPDMRRWRAISAARSVFQNRIRDVLEYAFDDAASDEPHSNESTSQVPA